MHNTIQMQICTKAVYNPIQNTEGNMHLIKRQLLYCVIIATFCVYFSLALSEYTNIAYNQISAVDDAHSYCPRPQRQYFYKYLYRRDNCDNRKVVCNISSRVIVR